MRSFSTHYDKIIGTGIHNGNNDVLLCAKNTAIIQKCVTSGNYIHTIKITKPVMGLPCLNLKKEENF